jgi:integrase/recombinase XerD
VSEQRAPSGLVPAGATGIGRAGDDRDGLAVAGDPARHPAAVYLARLSPGSRRTMREALDTVARIVRRGEMAVTLPWHELRYEHVQAVRAVLAERYAPATANKLLAALKGALKEAWRLGLMDGEPYQCAVDVAGVEATTLPRGRALAAGELAALLRACAADVRATGARDAALLAVLYGAGLRRAEAVALALADCEPVGGALTVWSGKGHKARVVYPAAGSATALADWLAVRGAAPGSLLCPVDKAGRVAVRRMTTQAVLGILRRRARAAGVARFSPHDLRRSFVSDLLDAGADVSAVQQLAGHASVQTTLRYDRRGERAKAKAAGLLHLPYVGRRTASGPEARQG